MMKLIYCKGVMKILFHDVCKRERPANVTKGHTHFTAFHFIPSLFSSGNIYVFNSIYKFTSLSGCLG